MKAIRHGKFKVAATRIRALRERLVNQTQGEIFPDHFCFGCESAVLYKIGRGLRCQGCASINTSGGTQQALDYGLQTVLTRTRGPNGMELYSEPKL